MRIFYIVPFWSLVYELHILAWNLRFHCIDHAGIELDQERTDILMVSSLFEIKTLAYYTFCDVCSENVLEIDVQPNNFLPEWIEGTFNRLGIFRLAVTIEADHRIAVSFHVSWREVLTLVKVKHERITKLLLIVTLDRLVLWSSVRVKIDSAS